MMKGEGEQDIEAAGNCFVERLAAHEECTGNMNQEYDDAMEGVTEIDHKVVAKWAMENKDAKFVRAMKKFMGKKEKRMKKRAERKARRAAKEAARMNSDE